MKFKSMPWTQLPNKMYFMKRGREERKRKVGREKWRKRECSTHVGQVVTESVYRNASHDLIPGPATWEAPDILLKMQNPDLLSQTLWRRWPASCVFIVARLSWWMLSVGDHSSSWNATRKGAATWAWDADAELSSFSMRSVGSTTYVWTVCWKADKE